MQIRRNYSEPFFGGKRRRRNLGGVLFFVGLFIGAALLVIALNFDRIQTAATELFSELPTPTPYPGELATEAARLVIAGDLDEAAALFERAIAQRPDDIDYLYAYARLLIDLEEYDRVEEMGDHAIEVDSSDPRGYALKAEALVLSGNPSAAIPVALDGIDRDADFGPLYAALSRAYVDTGRYLDAVEIGLQAVELSPADADIRRAYAYALNWAGYNVDATTQLEQAVAVDPNRIPAYFELAYQYLAQNRDQDAIDIYNRITAIQPNNARALLRLCEAYRKIGQFERATGYCDDAVRADPTYAEAFLQLGLLRYNAFNFPAARDAFTSCVANDPASLVCTYRLGLTYYYLGDCDTAWSMLRDSLVMARARSGTETAIEDISLGFQAIEQQCPQYSGSSGIVDLTPQVTP